jgi:single-stranded-DNA-specific exonuclease
MAEKRWLIKEPFKSTEIEDFRSKLKVSPIIAQLLLQRGIKSFEEAEEFFRPDIKDLYDPFLMADMKTAVDRLKEAMEKRESVLLYGDYDVDGTTSVAMMHSFLKDRDAQINYYIPDRYSEGYGVSEKGIEFAIEKKVELLITLDCGIRAHENIAKAKAAGIDVIVCDHHRPGDELPDAIVLNPKRVDCSYPYKELSGCGVGFKLLQGFASGSNTELDKLFGLMDLLAISIGADIVDITDENRIMAHHGLKLLNANPRTSFKKLVELSKKEFPLSLTDVIFTIAPRINAAGRLRTGKYAVELMVSNEDEVITELAEAIEADNLERRSLDSAMTEEALEIIEQDDDFENRVTTVLYKPEWHKGVVGIVASRVLESYYRPTIILTESNGSITGSARSIREFDIHEAISKCSSLLEKFGGHMYAAGLSMSPDNLHAFIDEFESVVSSSIDKKTLVEEQIVDVELGFNEIFTSDENRMKIPRIKRIISQFEPHGPGNMKPVFMTKNVFATDVRLLKEKHLKLTMVQPAFDVAVEGIGFNMIDKMDNVAAGIPFDVLYTLEINRWKGRETLQLNIKDIRSSV